MKKVTVIGAGFAGLTLARELQARGLQVEILEKQPHAGGLIRSLTTPSGVVERGASSFLRTARFDRLLAELGVDVIEPSKDSRKRLFYAGRLTRWPLSARETAELPFRFLRAKLRGTLRPVAGETISQWGRRSVGHAVVERFLGPALQGIYATDAENLSASLVLGPLFGNKKRDKYRGVVAVRDGNQRVIEALERDIIAKGGVIRYGTDANAERPTGPLVVATSAVAAAEFFGKDHPVLARRLAAIRMAPLVSLTAFYAEATGPRAFGCLVPRRQGIRVLGVLLNHAIFPQRGGKPGETWIFGGAGDPDAVLLSDEKLVELQRAERKILFGKDDAPVETTISRWSEGLPNYDVVLEDVLKDLSVPAGVWLHGNWLGGIGLSKILERSEALAEKIAKELQ